MKLATIFLLAVAAFAGHDDWKRVPHNTPGTPTPEPGTIVLIGLGLTGLIAYKVRKNRE